MKSISIILVLAFGAVFCSCKTQNSPPEANQPIPQAPNNEGPPGVEEIFKMDDEDGDGKLSKSEVKGPLLHDFDKVDTDGDGFISKAELENAPKPERGNRPPRRN